MYSMHTHDHDHDHGHHHEHGEHCGCGCEHDHHHHEEIEIRPIEGMSIVQQNMLLALLQRRYLPVACFTLASAENPGARSTALAPVYIGAQADTLEDIKALGAALRQLEDSGYITLDYDQPLEGYPYAEYHASQAFGFFRQTVAEAASRPGFVFDTPLLELGSMALTAQGEEKTRAMLPEQEKM